MHDGNGVWYGIILSSGAKQELGRAMLKQVLKASKSLKDAASKLVIDISTLVGKKWEQAMQGIKSGWQDAESLLQFDRHLNTKNSAAIHFFSSCRSGRICFPE
jgi:hypothetical protein